MKTSLPVVAAMVLGYMPGMLIILFAISVAHKRFWIKSREEKAAKKKNRNAKIPSPLWPVWSERLKFTLKDTRSVKLGKKQTEGGLTNRNMFFVILGAGFVMVLTGAILGKYAIAAVGYVLFFVAVAFSVSTAKSVLETRRKKLTQMYSIAKLKLGVSAENDANPGAVVRIKEWRDLLIPTSVEFDIPNSFDASGEEGFLRHFNQYFGKENSWVPTIDPEKEIWGFDYEKELLTINSVPPLPQSAPWDEHYVVNEKVAWSFFPIALGIENGIELENPKTGQMENVLGFDLSGTQVDMAKKLGMKIGGEISTSPMVFIGGGTGGGKSLSVATKIIVKK